MRQTSNANTLSLSWYALGAPITPGPTSYATGTVWLEPQHIEAWLTDPEGTWEAETVVPAAAEFQYRLTKFYPTAP